MDFPLLISFTSYFITIFIKLLYWAIFIWVLMSWFSAGKTPLGELLESIVLPILKPFKWARIGMFDLSPILALLVLGFLGDKAKLFLQTFL